jgi:hypothetical protein
VDYGNRYSRELASRDDAERRRLLAQVVESSGDSCPRAALTEYKGHEGPKAFWHVDCGPADYLVQIDGDASTTVLACSIVRSFGKDDCREKW